MQIPKISLWLGTLVLGAALSAHAIDNPDQAAARAALEAKMRELDAQPEAAANPAVVAPAVPVIVNSKVEGAKPANTRDNSDQAASRAALEAEMRQMNSREPVTTVKTGAPGSVSYPGKKLGLNPIDVPALPISAGKQSQLEALLARYKADQITPEEYHKARAEILAAP